MMAEDRTFDRIDRAIHGFDPGDPCPGGCPIDDTLSDYFKGWLPSSASETVELHLSRCRQARIALLTIANMAMDKRTQPQPMVSSGLCSLASRPDHIDERALSSASALQALVTHLDPVIHRRVSKLSCATPETDPEDLKQHVWVKLLENDGALLHAYDPERGASFEGYTGMVARSLAKDWIKRARRAKARDADPEHNLDQNVILDPEQRTFSRVELDALLRHLKTVLPLRTRLIMAYRLFDGRTTPQIARTLDVSHQVVYNEVHRIRITALAYQASTRDNPKPTSR